LQSSNGFSGNKRKELKILDGSSRVAIVLGGSFRWWQFSGWQLS